MLRFSQPKRSAPRRRHSADVTRRERQPGDRIGCGIVGHPQRHRILAKRVGQLVDAGLHRKAGRHARRARACSRASAHRCGPAARRPRKFAKPWRRELSAVYSPGNRSCREVCASTSWMAATIRPDSIGAKPDVMPAGWAEARIVENAARGTTSFTGRPVGARQRPPAPSASAASSSGRSRRRRKARSPRPAPALMPSALARPCRMASAFCVPS